MWNMNTWTMSYQQEECENENMRETIKNQKASKSIDFM